MTILHEYATIRVEEDTVSGVIPLDKQKADPQVTFYTKAGCHLCDDARDMLDEIAEQHKYELTETDIRSTPELFEQYRYRIPVIIVDGTKTIEGRIDFDELTSAFQ